MSPSTSRIESAAFRVLLAAVFLAPLAFLPTPYIALDLVKTVVIVLGSLASAILYSIVAYKERSLSLPPRRMLWSALIVVASLVISTATGIQGIRSFFGQGFETGTASFIIILFVAALAAYSAIVRKPERAILVYASMASSFLVLFVFQALRLAFGQGFASLGILSSVTSTVAGGWYDLAGIAIIIALISIFALLFLPLSRRMRGFYWAIGIVSVVGAYIIDDPRAWGAAALVLLGLSIHLFRMRGPSLSFAKRIAWLPLIACVIALALVWKGSVLASPAVVAVGASHSEIALPWQLTVDVASSAIKDQPLFGVGPNHFSRAYLAYKPSTVNATDAWGVEFASGFGLLPTFLVTQGSLGALAWIIFLSCLGILIARALKLLPVDPRARFAVGSSAAATAFLWILMLVTVPSHALLFYAFILTGAFVGAGASYGCFAGLIVVPSAPRSQKLMGLFLILAIIVGALWAIEYAKKTTALAYFGSGVKQLTVNGNADMADADFRAALTLDSSDIYWQGRAEAGMAKVRELAATVTATSTATTSQIVLGQVVSALNQSLSYAQNAISYDAGNYYNYLSKARVAELASSIGVPQGYETAVAAYTDAIRKNPYNPVLYLSLARLQVSNNKLDDAQKTVGAALQVKSNYLDAIFLLSQIEASQGNLKDAITAAQVAAQINPQDATIFFQLGILQYENKDYDSASKSLASAVALQPGYANAQYFLGLSYARLGRNEEAIAQFAALAQTNPDNQEVALILTNLKEGKSPFTDAKPPITTSPEKRPTLPVKEKAQ